MSDPQAYAVIKSFITRERAMREKVFRAKPDLLRQKLAECDHALAALESFAPVPVAPSAAQSTLFDEA